MTPIYEVKTKHTEEVLKDFVKFSHRMKSARAPVKMTMLAMCFFMLAYAFQGMIQTYIFAALGVLVVILMLSTRRIAFGKLAKNDKNYQNQSEIDFVFGHSAFMVKNPEEELRDNIKYGEVTVMYKDDKYYYLNVNNQELFMLPRTDFVLGEADTFEEFLTEKTGKQVNVTKVPWKVRVAMAKAQIAEQDEIKQKAWEERKKAKKQK